MDQDLIGRVQVYLLLGAIASADFANAKPFKATVGERRKNLYRADLDIEHKQADFEYFVDQTSTTLKNGGFNDDFIGMINWSAFRQKEVWAALKTINDKLAVIAEYQGTDCPCISDLVEYAQSLEVTAEAKRLRALKS